jgi:hypothetical protein
MPKETGGLSLPTDIVRNLFRSELFKNPHLTNPIKDGGKDDLFTLAYKLDYAPQEYFNETDRLLHKLKTNLSVESAIDIAKLEVKRDLCVKALNTALSEDGSGVSSYTSLRF